jgi:chromosome segregation ATPase
MSVRREKYNKIKKTLERCMVENAEKSLEILRQSHRIDSLESDVNRWKSLSERLPDDAEFEELRKENRKLIKVIDTLEKQISKLENNKEMLLFQIKTIEECKNDLKIQMKEMRFGMNTVNS